MTKFAIVYGVISGAIAIGTVVLGLTLSNADTQYSGAQWLGYLVMLVALSMVFVGVKRYRDQQHGGYITFWQALGMGVSIAAVAGIIYVGVWETYLFSTDYVFIAQYTDGIISEQESKGISGAALETLKADMAQMQQSYANVFYRLFITFLEIFPVGLFIAIVSAAMLRRQQPQSLYQDA